MSRTFTVIKREFTESTRSKMFIIMTLFGPLLIAGLFAFQIVMFRSTGGEKKIVIVDATPQRLGPQVAAVLKSAGAGTARARATTYTSEVMTIAGQDTAQLRQQLSQRVVNDELDGVLWLSPTVLAGDSVRYDGKNATVMQEMGQMEAAVQAAVQTARLGAAGVDPRAVATALQRVPFSPRKAGKGAVKGNAAAIFGVAYFMGYITLLVIILYGAAVQRGVLEEKKDRIVEVITSSIRAEQLMFGKVVGIGGASLLQISIWAGFAALALHYGNPLLVRMGAGTIDLPKIPSSVLFLFLFFFAGGFFLYSSLYAALGALATTDQEGQQLLLPVTMILMVSYFVSFRVMNAPDSTIAIVASMVPFSAPLIVPVRAMMTNVPTIQLIASAVLLIGGGLFITWLGGKIYRIGVLTTGKKPTFMEVVRWLRTA
jgi:ABC-2 type transport system permease protein